MNLKLVKGRKAGPEQYQSILGKTFVTRLMGRPMLEIGSDSWSMHAMVNEVGVGNQKAARIISGIAKAEGYKNVRDMYNRSSPYSLADTLAGVTSLYVLIEVFKTKGLDIDKWYTLGENQARVMFQHYKKRELEARKRTERHAERKVASRAHGPRKRSRSRS